MSGALGNNSGERSPPGAVEARCGSPRAVETGVVGRVGSLRLCLIGEVVNASMLTLWLGGCGVCPALILRDRPSGEPEGGVAASN